MTNSYPWPHICEQIVQFGPITDQGVAVGGAFDSDAATGMMAIAHRVAGVLTFPRS